MSHQKGSVGLIGLGNMGREMALSLTRGGFDVIGYDEKLDAITPLEKEGVKRASSIADVCKSTLTIILPLPTPLTIENVVCGDDGIVRHGRPCTLLIDTSTSDPTTTRKIAQRLSERGIHVVDAPVSGGPRAASNGKLTMMMGGEVADITRSEPFVATFSASRIHVGQLGCAHAAKLINNLLCATHLIAVGEALRVAEAAALDPNRLLAAINAGSGRSAVTEINCPTWVLNNTFQSGFTMKLMRKDVGLALSFAKEMDLLLPLSAEVSRLWEASRSSLADSEDFNRIVTWSEAQRQGARK